MEIATKMGQMTSTCRTRTFFREIVGKLLELVSDIGGNITLFLDILIAPAQVILVFHRTRQCDGLPLAAISRQQYFGSGNKPQSTLRSINQANHHSGIIITGTLEQL